MIESKEHLRKLWGRVLVFLKALFICSLAIIFSPLSSYGADQELCDVAKTSIINACDRQDVSAMGFKIKENRSNLPANFSAINRVTNNCLHSLLQCTKHCSSTNNPYLSTASIDSLMSSLAFKRDLTVDKGVYFCFKQVQNKYSPSLLGSAEEESGSCQRISKNTLQNPNAPETLFRKRCKQLISLNQSRIEAEQLSRNPDPGGCKADSTKANPLIWNPEEKKCNRKLSMRAAPLLEEKSDKSKVLFKQSSVAPELPVKKEIVLQEPEVVKPKEQIIDDKATKSTIADKPKDEPEVPDTEPPVTPGEASDQKGPNIFDDIGEKAYRKSEEKTEHSPALLSEGGTNSNYIPDVGNIEVGNLPENEITNTANSEFRDKDYSSSKVAVIGNMRPIKPLSRGPKKWSGYSPNRKKGSVNDKSAPTSGASTPQFSKRNNSQKALNSKRVSRKSSLWAAAKQLITKSFFGGGQGALNNTQNSNNRYNKSNSILPSPQRVLSSQGRNRDIQNLKKSYHSHMPNNQMPIYGKGLFEGQYKGVISEILKREATLNKNGCMPPLNTCQAK